MYVQYKSKYDIGQSIYKIKDNKIEEWQIKCIKYRCVQAEDGLEEHNTSYIIRCITYPSYSHKDFTQKEIDETFFKDKKDIIKMIADQL